MTFLKGMWYELGDLGYDAAVWAPLPSRILKMGKSLEDPRKYYPGDIRDAAYAFLSDVAMSYRAFAPVPIIRAFCDRYQAGHGIRPLETLNNVYGAQASGQYSNCEFDSVAMESITLRYDISEDDILRVEALIRSSDPLTFLCDKVFLRLAEVDYR